MLSELGLVLLLALANGFFALSEMAMVTARRSRLKQMARTSKRAALALKLAQSPERFLSTVQVGITLIAIVTGVVTGANIGDHIMLWLQSLGWTPLLPYARPLGYALGIALITYLNIVVGELVPKRLALVAPEQLALLVGAPMLALARLTAPFVLVLNFSSNALLRLLRLGRVTPERISEEEIRLLVAESAEQGVLDEDERAMVSRVLRLGDRSVGSVMTPRTRIAWLDAAAGIEENLTVLRETPYSRYPVYRGSESEVLGVLEVKSLLEPMTRGVVLPGLFRTLARPLYVPSSARALDLLEQFRDAQTPLALVVDEYGDIEGLVTINNLLEAVVGRAAPSSDGAPPMNAPIVRRADGSFSVDGALSIEDLRELLGTMQMPEAPDLEYHTVAGLIMARLGRIPALGEVFDWQGLRFEILDLDGARIDRVLLSVLPQDAQK